MTFIAPAGIRPARTWARATAFVTSALLAERERWALWLPVALGCGVAAYFALPAEPSPWLGPTALGTLLLAGIVLRARPAAVLAILFISAGATGFTAAQLRTALVAAPVLQRELGPVAVTGRIVLVEQRPTDRRLTLADLTIQRLAPDQTPAFVRVTVRARNGGVLAPGQVVSLRAVLQPPAAPAMPGAYDFARDAWFDRVGGVGYAVNAPTIRSNDAPPWNEMLAAFRHRLAQRIYAVLDGQVGAVAAALTTGERAGIDEKTWDALRDSGLAHIISISGLHFALIAGILFFSVRAALAAIEPLALRFPIKKWAAVAALTGSFGYFLLAGANAPTERSFLMLGLAMVAILVDRRPLSMRLVAWAAAIVLLVAPDSVLGPSFQMSFAAVVALIATYEVVRPHFARWHSEAGLVGAGVLYVVGIGLSTLVAGTATAAYAVYHFDRFASYSLIANLAAVPLTGLWIMPWALIAFTLMPFGLEAFALRPMGWGVEAMLRIGDTVAGWPGASILLPAMPPIGLAAVTLGGLWLCLWQTRWRLVGMAGLAFGVATIWLTPRPDVLISDDGIHIAVRAADGSFWLSARRPNFTTETWVRRDGWERGGRFPPPGAASADERLRCDRLGCLYRAKGKLVALVRKEEALAEDCRAADAVVATVAVFVPCPAGVVIDRLDLWRAGAHALWLGPAGARVRTVAEGRGQRPWVLPRPKQE